MNKKVFLSIEGHDRPYGSALVPETLLDANFFVVNRYNGDIQRSIPHRIGMLDWKDPEDQIKKAFRAIFSPSIDELIWLADIKFKGDGIEYKLDYANVLPTEDYGGFKRGGGHEQAFRARFVKRITQADVAWDKKQRGATKTAAPETDWSGNW